MGSQFNNLDRKLRNVVPSVNGNSPALNSLINRLAYISSSDVHFPRRNGCDVVFFFVKLESCDGGGGGDMEEEGGKMTFTGVEVIMDGRCCCVLPLPTEDEDGESEGSFGCCCFIICEVVAGAFGRYLGGTTRRVVAVCPPPPMGTFADDDDKTGCGTGAERVSRLLEALLL